MQSLTALYKGHELFIIIIIKHMFCKKESVKRIQLYTRQKYYKKYLLRKLAKKTIEQTTQQWTLTLKTISRSSEIIGSEELHGI